MECQDARVGSSIPSLDRWKLGRDERTRRNRRGTSGGEGRKGLSRRNGGHHSKPSSPKKEKGRRKKRMQANEEGDVVDLFSVVFWIIVLYLGQRDRKIGGDGLLSPWDGKDG
ncbi:hypothetical protein NL676_016679 [Syzygium grande]|nr:hypothetical protein NL676_016679 [Syzygium grande]